MDNSNNSGAVIGENVKRLPLKDLVKRIGPGLIATGIVIGPVASAVVGIAVFVACLFFTMGNISGTGAGMNLIFGIDWKIGSIIMIAIVIYCYFAKNVYSKVERIITICMTISYLFALVLTISALSTQIPKLLALFGIS
jgi:Mn2+/Fe2+ NRAMP family transporter